jgi:hypothetical protein
MRRVFLLLVALGAAACAAPAESPAEETDEADVQIAAGVFVANPRETSGAEVADGRLRFPLADAARLRALEPGTVLVGARGQSKNPDGFLRRVSKITIEGDALVVETTPATITDAILRGQLRASNGARSIDTELSANKVGKIDLDVSGQSLFENEDVVRGRSFRESIRFESGRFTSSPTVEVDLRIANGRVSRFVAKVEGNLDASLKAIARVGADGEVDDAMLAELHAKKHEVRKVLYESKRLPLPTFNVGNVPVSPSVKLTLALRCELAFGGPLVATAGVEAKSFVRMGGVYANGAWGAPIQSEFDIRPTFAMERAGEIDARCALEANAELFAFGESGVTMSVAPYLDFEVAKPAGEKPGTAAAFLSYRVEAGATGSMRGTSPVFGVPDLDRELVSWKGAQPLTGTSRE